MKTISIIKDDRIKTFNPMFIKCVELIRNEINNNWCVNVVHIVNDREISEPIVISDHDSAQALYDEYKSCLESI